MVKELIKEDYLKVDKDEHISRLIGLMIKTGQKAALVFDKNKLIGVTSNALLMKTKLDPSKVKVSKAMTKAPILNGTEDIKEVARLLFASNSPILPVVDKKKALLGVIHLIDVVEQLRYMPDSKGKIGDVMTPKLYVLNENDTLGTAINLLKHHHISKLPMVNKRWELIGIVSITDIMEKYHLFHQGSYDKGKGGIPLGSKKQAGSLRGKQDDFDKYPAINFASGDVVTASPDESVGAVINKMEENNISSIVLIEKEKPVGIVTLRDMLELLLKENVTF